MIRSQVYLTQYEKKSLESIAESTGKKQSELIREAIDNFIAKVKNRSKKDIFNDLSGVWADREDTFNAENLRESWERNQ